MNNSMVKGDEMSSNYPPGVTGTEEYFEDNTLTKLKRGEIKAYREFVNKRDGNLKERKGERGRFGALGKRGFGDYLYTTDKAMFFCMLDVDKRSGEFKF